MPDPEQSRIEAAALARLIAEGIVDPAMVRDSWSPELVARMTGECCADPETVAAIRRTHPGFAACDPTDP